MDLRELNKKLKSLDQKEIEKKVLNSKEITNWIVQEIKNSLNKGENAEGDLLGIYEGLTQLIAENPLRFGSIKPIKPKIAGEPYNMQWSGNLFKSIKVWYHGNFTYETFAEGDFLDGRDENQIINLQDEQIEELERIANNNTAKFINTKIK